MSEASFVERRFELGGDELVVRFYAPAKAAGGEFQCRCTIGWPDGEVRRHICGVDGVQAIMLAMRVVHSELLASDAYKSGMLTYYGQPDLDLPPSWETAPP